MAGPHLRFVQVIWQGLSIARHEHAEHADRALHMYSFPASPFALPIHVNCQHANLYLRA